MTYFPFHKEFDEVFSDKSHWLKKFLYFELFFVFFSVIMAIKLHEEEGFKISSGQWLSCIGFFLYVSISIFIILQAGDWAARIKNAGLQFLFWFFGIFGFLIWLIITCIWVMVIGDF